ncbi:MAG: hypothetical protein WCI91_02230 [Candidatus Nomurabacteria bacterium]
MDVEKNEVKQAFLFLFDWAHVENAGTNHSKEKKNEENSDMNNSSHLPGVH